MRLIDTNGVLGDGYNAIKLREFEHRGSESGNLAEVLTIHRKNLINRKEHFASKISTVRAGGGTNKKKTLLLLSRHTTLRAGVSL